MKEQTVKMTKGEPKRRKAVRQEKVYYAHAMCLYGRLDELQELRLIRRRFRRASIVNPARYNDHPDKRTDTVGFCLALIDGCGVVVFSRCLGRITAGVGKEVNHAIKTGKTVFELTAGKLVPRTRRVKHISRIATIRLYQRYRGW